MDRRGLISRTRDLRDWPLAVQYALSLAVVALALLIRWLLNPVLDVDLPFATVFAALLPIVVLLRTGPFLAGATLGLVGTWYLFMPPVHTFQIASTGVGLRLAVFTGAMGVAAATTWFAQRSRDRLHNAEFALVQNQQTLVEVVQRAPFGLYIVDADFRIAHLNEGSAAGAFRNVRPVIGRDFAEAMHILWPEPFASQAVAIFRHTLETGEPYYSPGLTETRADTASTESYEWQVHRIVMPDGRSGVVCYYFDTTKLTQAQQALRDVDRRKDQFLATLSHELRNPLASLSHAIELLERIDNPDPVAVQTRATVRRQVLYMVRLIDDLLDISRIASDKLVLQKERVELATLLARAVADNRPSCESRGHAMSVSVPPRPLWLDADPTRITQVIGNLLNNAVKYTPAGGQIAVRARADGDQVVVTVTDDGIGIKPDDLPRVFEAFAQVHGDPSLTQGGLGIGLSLVKRLAELHGGSVAAHSDGPGRGSTFELRLPAASAPALDVADDAAPSPALASADASSMSADGDASQRRDAPAGDSLMPASSPASSAAPGPSSSASSAATAVAPATSSSARTPRGRRILVVDDNADAAESLVRLLEIAGHQTRLALDGPPAITEALDFRPEIVLLDIGLPSMTGYDVCRELRGKCPTPQPTIIALTGWGQDNDREQSAAAGFDHHLVKPIQYAALTKLLASLG